MRLTFRLPMSGLSLVEVLVAFGLTSMCLMFVLAVLPMGVKASRQAARLQAATAWSRHLVETCPPPREIPVPESLAQMEFRTVQDGVLYEAVRTVTPLGPLLTRIEVETTWSGNSEPLRLALVRYEAERIKANR